jgi:hypothetical protein
MDRSQPPGMHIRATIGDVANSQVAIGSDIRQTNAPAPPTDAELQELVQTIARLREQVASEAPADQRAAAVAKVDELAEALALPEPDLATMESVRNWFVRRLPALAGGVVSLVVHPIVGRLVGAAGDAAAAEFRRRFGA